MKTVFALALIFAVAFSSSSFLGSYDKLKAKLQSIDNTEFGRNLLDTIALQMDSQSPMADISNLIRDMMNDLRSQQQAADEAHSAKMSECADQQAAYQARIDHATTEISDATSAIKSLRALKRGLEKNIATAEATLILLDEQEAAARAKRAQDSIDFFARQEQTKQVLDALEVIIPKLKAITPHTAAETFMELAKLGSSNPIAALVEVASSLDAEALTRCINLLEELQVDFAVFLDDDIENEIQAQVDFDNLMIEIAAMRKATQAQLAADRVSLAETETSLENQQRRLQENEQELESATAGLRAKVDECNAYDAAYNRDTNQRNEELDILEQVAQIVATRLSGLDDFMGAR